MPVQTGGELKFPEFNKLERFAQLEYFPHFLILIAAFSIYWTSLSGTFIFSWDDLPYIVHNQAAHGFSIENLRMAFSNYYVGNYAPLHIISYMLDFDIWGLNPFGYRLHNLFLHSANTLLLYLVVKNCEGRQATALLASLLFLIHPVQVETVAWISQRKNLLALFFSLLSILSYIRYRSSENRRIQFFIFSLIAFTSALLSKSVAVVIPGILLLYDLCILRLQLNSRNILDKIPFLLSAVVCALVAYESQSVSNGGGRADYHGGSLSSTMFSMFPVFLDYIRMFFWPSGLSAFYDVAIRKTLDTVAAASMSGVFLLLGVWLSSYRKHKHIFFWGAVFILGLLPVSQIIPIVTLKNDRYLYFPMIGASVLFAIAFMMIYDRIQGKLKTLFITVAALLLASLGVATHQRSLVWKNQMTLWSDAASKNPGNWFVWVGIAHSYHEKRLYEDARKAYFRALGISPNVRTLNDLALLHLDTGEPERAIQMLETAIADSPTDVVPYTSLGNSYLFTGAYNSARDIFRHLATMQGGAARSEIGLATADLLEGKLTEAESRYKKALSLGALQCDYYFGMASIESVRGNIPKSLEYLEKSFKEGFIDFTGLMTDKELANTRSSAYFKPLVKKYSNRELP